jgi:putative ABC transport system permease protein
MGKIMSGVFFEGLMQDVRSVMRVLRTSPGFMTAAILTLALGIGANTAIFSVVNAVLLKPLSYPDADRMVEFGTRSSVLANFLSNIPKFHAYKRQTSVFKEVAAYDNAGPGFNLTGDRPEQVRGLHVTEGYFRLYGAPIALGRTFIKQEDLPHGGKVAVLSYGLWQRRFGGNPGIVGQSILLGNEPYTVVGVVGQSFVSDPAADLWLPFQFEPASADMNNFFQVAGLLRSGVTLDQANAQLKLAAAQFHRDFPKIDPHEEFSVQPLQDSIVGDVRKSLLILLGAVSLVLLIACANVANLLLVRATGRKREFAIRAALGASRGRIVRQLLTESVLLSVAGGLLGLVVGFGGVRGLLAFSPAGLPRVGESGSAIGLDWRVLAFTVCMSLTTGVLFGLVPALSASRTDLNTTLKENSTRSGSSVRQGRVRSLLIITEVSLALVLLVGSALLIRTLAALRGVDPGFDARNVLTLEMSMTSAQLHTAAGISQLSRQGRDRLNASPGVKLAATSVWLPNQVDDGLPFQIIGRPVEKSMAGARFTSISPGFLKVFNIPLLRGRDINENDIAGKPGVVMINQALAKQYWPNEDPVGQHIMIGGDIGPTFAGETTRTVIGIVGDTHNNGLGRPPDGMMIVPTAQVPDGYQAAYSDTSALVWVVRTQADPHLLIAAITEQLRLASHGFPVAHVRTMDEVMGRSTQHESFNMLLLSIFGLVALALASIGIYGVMAYTVAQRTQEMGIRMALGADRAAIRRLVVWHGMRLALIGVALGIAAALGLTRLIASFLFGVTSWDPAAFLFAPLILVAVALLAVWLPAARASKAHLMQALRVE